jgi:hypothetical protein
VFGTFRLGNDSRSEENEVKLSKYMQGAWVAFARDPTNGLGRYGWPTYNPSTASLAQLGGFYNPAAITYANATVVDFTCRAAGTLNGVLGQLLWLLGPSAKLGIF